MSLLGKKLLRSSMIRMAQFFINVVIALIMMPFIIHSLGDEMYGVWILIGSFLGYYGLLEFGLNFAVKRYASKAIILKDYDEVNKVVNTSLFIFSIIGVVTMLLSLVVAFFVPMFIKNIVHIDTFRSVIIILGISISIGFPLRVFSGFLTADIRYDLLALIELAKLLARTICVVFFLSKGFGILALAIITFSTDIGEYLFTFFFMKHHYKYIKLGVQFIDRKRIKMLFNYSIYAFISQIANQLRFNIDNVVIVKFIGLNSVTVYSIGARLISYFSEFILSALGMTLPVFSGFDAKGDYESIRQKYILLTKVSSYLSIFVTSILIIFGKVFIIKWMGNEYKEAYSILLILLIPFLFELMQPCTGVLYGLSKHKFSAIANLLEGVANLVLSVVLVKDYGIYGVALGTAIPMCINKLFVLPYYVCKTIGLKFVELYVKLLVPILAVSCIILYVFWSIIKWFISPNYSVIITLIILEFLIVSAVVYFFGFNKEELKYLKGLLPFNFKPRA